MVLAEISCTCGHRFSVADDGTGVPHPCPSCRVRNVLPRRMNGESHDHSRVVLGETAVRGTRVLSGIGAGHSSVLRGLPEGTQLGPYRLVRRIGKGGMGSVYEAIDERGGARVALKVLSPDLVERPDFVARFHREANALAGLSDDRIARVYFSGAADQIPFFAMEFIDGKNLEQLLAEKGRPTASRAIEWMREAAIGLSTAAERGIIHRDVKPTNLLVDHDGKLKIVDFGLAKAIDSESRLTMTGAVVGTPYYLSPEQGLGKAVDQRSDIYSLGATFYHLLAGKPPFDAESPVSIIMKHISDAPDPLSKAQPSVPDPLARIIMRCLAKDPRRRYADYDELIDDLDAASKGEPVLAPAEEVSIRRSQPSFVVVDEFEEGSKLLRRATVTRRTFALVFDLVVLKLIHGLFVQLGPAGFDIRPMFAVVAFLYLAVGDGFGGVSLGKRFFRLRVARPDGSDLGPLRAMGRIAFLAPICSITLWFAPRGLYSPSTLVAEFERTLQHLIGHSVERELIAYGLNVLGAAIVIDLVFILFTRRASTLHDLLSGTFVFREETVKRRPRRRRQTGHRPITPIVPLLASIVPGVGQLINGQMGKALLVFIAFTIGLMIPGVGILVMGGAAWEAFSFASKRRDEWDKSNGPLAT